MADKQKYRDSAVGEDFVVINKVRYQKDDAIRLGLIKGKKQEDGSVEELSPEDATMITIDGVRFTRADAKRLGRIDADGNIVHTAEKLERSSTTSVLGTAVVDQAPPSEDEAEARAKAEKEANDKAEAEAEATKKAEEEATKKAEEEAAAKVAKAKAAAAPPTKE